MAEDTPEGMRQCDVCGDYEVLEDLTDWEGLTLCQECLDEDDE